MSQLQKIIYLTRQQYETLLSNNNTGQITYGGITLTGVQDNNIYFITDETVSATDLGNDFLLNVPHGGTGKSSFTPNSIIGSGTSSTANFISITKATSITDTNDAIPTSHAVYNDTLLKSGGTMTGAFNTANGTWNNIGDDCRLGDINKAGHIGIQGINGHTGIHFTTYNQSNKLVGGAITWDGTKFTITSTSPVVADISGNAGTATSLATGRTLKVNLASTAASTAFTGTANITDIGVSGTLSIANGGTGLSSTTARYAFIGPSSNGAPTWRKLENADLPSSGQITIAGVTASLGGSISLEQMGLSSAMHYRGAVTANPTTTTPTGTYVSGDVLINSSNSKEFVYDGTNWREIGDESSFKVKQTAITSTTGTAGTTAVTNFLYSFAQDANGVVSVENRPLPTATSAVAGITTVGASGGAATYSHSHGNISNTGTISTSAAIANNDALVIAAATSGTVKKTSIVFDGSTTSQALTKKGTWGTFLTAHGSSYGKIASGAVSTTVTSISANTATIESKSANEKLTIQAGNKWIQTGATNSSNAGSDVITLGHLVPDNAISNLSTTAQTPSFNSTFNIPTISLDEAGHVTGVGNATVKIPALPSSVTPSSHKHGNINNDGTLGSTASYGVATDANKKIIAIDLSVSAPNASGNATTFVTSVTQSSQGKISVARSTIPDATTQVAGIMKLGASGGAATYDHTHSNYLTAHGKSYGGIQVSAQSTATAALTSSTAATTVTAVGANETVKFVTKNKWVVIKGSNSSTGGSDEVQIAHAAELTAKTAYCSTSATASANGGKITVTDIQYDEAGHITSTTDRTITLSQTTYTLSSLGAAASSHSHGNIANGGTIAVSTSSTIANGDTIVISTSANSGKLTRASITFDASTTTEYLNKKGSWGTPPDTKNTAGATATTSKIYLVGSTTQTANPQTYSTTYVHATDGVLSAKSFGVNYGTTDNKVTLQWNNTDSALEFVFA